MKGTWQEDLITFTQDIVRIPGCSTQEKAVAQRIRQEMERLGYDKILTDSSGSITGVLGNGPYHIFFDSHMDTVQVTDESAWTYPPFGAEIHDGRLYGRGASDMKGALAASVYAGALMKENGSLEGKTVYICCSAIEEDYDGEGTWRAITENRLKPDVAVICEPTHLKISLGQRGRSVFLIHTKGVSAHGAAPEKGVNAIYKMAEIIERVRALSDRLMSREGWHGSIAASRIESTAVSVNAVPDSCTLYLDRRTTVEENEEYLAGEMDELIKGTDASWEVYEVEGTSYMGAAVRLHSLLPAWELPGEHPLALAAEKCFREVLGREPETCRWDFSTNGVTTAGRLGIPTLGFGAGIEKMAHQTDEYCPVEDLIKACEFYSRLPQYL